MVSGCTSPPGRTLTTHLAKLIGLDNLTALSRVYGLEDHFDIPKAVDAVRYMRDEKIRADYATKSAGALAREHHLTERQVWKILGKRPIYLSGLFPESQPHAPLWRPRFILLLTKGFCVHSTQICMLLAQAVVRSTPQSMSEDRRLPLRTLTSGWHRQGTDPGFQVRELGRPR